MASTTSGLNFIHNIPKDVAVNLEFTNLTYKVNDRRKSSRIILNEISGSFRAGEFTAIIGPSGCGKTTILNLLLGYRIQRSSGHVMVNDSPQNIKEFRKISRYILQEDHISPYFTLMETMQFASNFKLDPMCSPEQRLVVINEILDIFQLQKQSDTKIAKLSGGEKKRLDIALELLGNPTVLFLDEPTTGLDEFSASQCIMVLKQLARSGHTVVCAMHSPSARLFAAFDKVYAMAKGQCIYQGAVDGIVPYLQRFNLNCPLNYNPADFLVEVAADEYGNYSDVLVQENNNGKVQQKDCKMLKEGNLKEHRNLKLNGYDTCSWWLEYKLIFLRILSQMWRDKTNIKLMTFSYLFEAIITGLVYKGTGNSANHGLAILYLLQTSLYVFIYLTVMPTLILVPQQMKYLRKEHFNQWYRLSSYFMALLTSHFPFMFVMVFMCSSIMYVLSGQPMELFRFVLFVIITLLTSMISSCYGICIGSRLSILNSLFLGPTFLSLWVYMCSYTIDKTHLSTFEQLLMYSNYPRQAVEAMLALTFKFNRSDLLCPPSELFCYMSKPRSYLKVVGSLDVSYNRSLMFLIGYLLLFATLAYVNLKCRLRS